MENITENITDNNKYCRRFVCSDEHFSGFTIIIDIRQIETIEDIIKIFNKLLLESLKDKNFENLIMILKTKGFHIHNVSIEDILTSGINDLHYICHHDKFL